MTKLATGCSTGSTWSTGNFPIVLDLGARDGGLAGRLARRPGTTRVVAGRTGDSVSSPARAASGSPPIPSWSPFRDASFDLVVSNLVLHWAGDLPGALVQLRRVLKPDGLLLAAMLGGQTLVELRTALFEAELEEEGGVSPRVSPSIELGDAAALLAARRLSRCRSPTARRSPSTYPDLLALMRDLRGMGETNALTARRRDFMRRTTLARAALIYAERFGEPDGHIPATFEVLFLCGWAPHPSQPTPLPRGSATVRLADALNRAPKVTARDASGG